MAQHHTKQIFDMKKKKAAHHGGQSEADELTEGKVPDTPAAVKQSVVRAQTFERLVKDRRLSHGAVRLFMALFCYYNKLTGRCFPSQLTLQADIGCSLNRIALWTKELIETGYLTIKREGRSINYSLNFAPSNENAQPRKRRATAGKRTEAEVIKCVLKIVRARHRDADEGEAHRVASQLAKSGWMKRNAETGIREKIYGGDAGKAAVVIGALRTIEAKREALSE